MLTKLHNIWQKGSSKLFSTYLCQYATHHTYSV